MIKLSKGERSVVRGFHPPASIRSRRGRSSACTYQLPGQVASVSRMPTGTIRPCVCSDARAAGRFTYFHRMKCSRMSVGEATPSARSEISAAQRTIAGSPSLVFGVHGGSDRKDRSEEHTSELQSRLHLVCRLLLEKKKHYACYQPPLHLVPLCGPQKRCCSDLPLSSCIHDHSVPVHPPDHHYARTPFIRYDSYHVT